ncbi:MAG: malto-oligosyltrehalose synthase [Chloroflexi bacterium]|nr:malto-oligosyltrehalose synthase [Chloroflexota bacterium]
MTPDPPKDNRRSNVPRATYRVQLHAAFTLDDAAAIVPYLADLGVSHLYTSPVLQAARGSMHGYDVVDHSRVSDELGGVEAFDRLIDALRARGMGLVLDIVPNHMAISDERNRWWWDVLEHGRLSRYASYFDVDWDPPESRLRNVILLPVLPDHYGRVLEAGEIQLARDGARLVITHGERRFPLDPQTVERIRTAAGEGTALDAAVAELNADPELLDEVLAVQHWRLAFWRSASRDLGYRRFFDIDDLIGLRMEDEDAFRDTHALILGWVAEGRVDGLRVDHPDGLRDPAAYFTQLRAAAPDAWIVAEKILDPDEALPTDWPIDGTTGYRFANLATGLQIDPAGESGMSAMWAEVADVGPAWETVVAAARREVLATLLGSDVNRLTAMFVAVCEANRRYRDFTRHELHHALREVAAALAVYRTYVRAGEAKVSDRDAGLIGDAIAVAVERRPDLDPELFRFLGRILRREVQGSLAAELAMNFQQLTPAAMAKGVEDTAFYRHHRLTALNEVGGDPGRFGTRVEGFHRAMELAQDHWPLAMLALSTHDTKRSADVRARLALITEDVDDWRDAVGRMTAAAVQHAARPGGPTAADAYLFFQIVVGAWPIDVERAAAHVAKASREAKLRTSWIAPNAAYDGALADFVHGCLADRAFVAAVAATVEPLLDPGRRAALSQVALQLTAPGVPDLYQGCELWDLSLVDPDNRRPVDYDLRRRLLVEISSLDAGEAWQRRDEGVPKLWLIQRALQIRTRRPEAFGREGIYRALSFRGEAADAVVGYTRGGTVATVVPRLVRRVARLGWSDTAVQLPPGRWVGLDGRVHTGTTLVHELLREFPVAILERPA